MSILYAEVSVIQEETLFRTMFRLTGYECAITDEDTVIMTFDNDEFPYDTRVEFSKRKKTFSFSEPKKDNFPLWFETDKERINTVWLKQSVVNADGIEQLDCTEMFKDYQKTNNSLERSAFNAIYYSMSDGKDLFGIIKIKSSPSKPRFIVGYNRRYFDKSDVVYLVHCFLTKTYET
jgi:hypothetical protein